MARGGHAFFFLDTRSVLFKKNLRASCYRAIILIMASFGFRKSLGLPRRSTKKYVLRFFSKNINRSENAVFW